MTEIARCFRSGNTLRITLGKRLRYKLGAIAGDTLAFNEDRTGAISVANLTEQHRAKGMPRKK